jgi:uracil-DNA glycosylase
MAFLETHDLRTTVASLVGWWQEAGVDSFIDESPRKWLETAAPAPNTRSDVDRSGDVDTDPLPLPVVAMPADHRSFLDWLATDTITLADYPVARRLAPEGNGDADLMIVTDVPERNDTDAGQLLTGEVGALFDKMLAAMKIDRARIYLATLAPARPAAAMLDEKAIEVLAPVLRHHIALVAPKKLWLMGRAVSRAVLAMDEVQAGGRLHIVNYDAVKVATIATLHPRVLLREPKSKARVWADMQKLIGTESA